LISTVAAWVYAMGFGVTAGLLVIGGTVAHRRGDRVTWRDVRLVVLDSVLWFLFWILVLTDRKARRRLARIFQPRTV
jgi:hypothetical protein